MLEMDEVEEEERVSKRGSERLNMGEIQRERREGVIERESKTE